MKWNVYYSCYKNRVSFSLRGIDFNNAEAVDTTLPSNSFFTTILTNATSFVILSGIASICNLSFILLLLINL